MFLGPIFSFILILVDEKRQLTFHKMLNISLRLLIVTGGANDNPELDCCSVNINSLTADNWS